LNPSGRYNQIDLRLTAGGFALAFEAEWDPPVCALFGPSGAGKSTILEIIAGVRAAGSARVVLDGRTVIDTGRGDVPPARVRRIGWVPQDASLFPHLTVRENVRYGLRRGGVDGETRLTAAIEVLEIGGLMDRPAGALSGGERQRAAVARAIGSGARVLLLDEPLASLDAPLRARVFPLFVRLRDEIGLPMIYVSHDPDEVMAIAPHVVVIAQGRCVASGPAKDVLGEAARDGIYDLHAAENRFEVRLVEARAAEGVAVVALDGGLRLQMHAAPLPERPVFTVALRAEEIILAAAPPGPVSAQNVVEGIVTDVRAVGGHALVTVDVGGERLAARVTRQSLDRLGLAAGARAWLVFKAGAVRAAGPTGRP
jgi:molybdate transport system ATP-binding protein